MRRRRGVGRRNFSHRVVASLSFPVQKPSLPVWPTFGPYSLSLTIFVIGGDGGRSLSFCAFRVSEALKSQRSGTTFSIQSRGIASRGAAVTRLFFTHLPASVNGSSFLSSLPLLMAAICLWRLHPRRADYDIRSSEHIYKSSRGLWLQQAAFRGLGTLQDTSIRDLSHNPTPSRSLC